MSDQDKRATVRVPVALRIRLRYQAVDQFISKFAINISRGGMFLSSRNPKPPGTELWFEIRLADESPVIEGSGQVRWIREYDRNRPGDPHGMGIQFIELSEESWPVLDRVIEHRRAIGESDDNAIPDPRGTMLGMGALPIAPAASVVVAREPDPAAPPPGDAHSRATLDLSDASGPWPQPLPRHPDQPGRPDDDRLRSELLRALTRPTPPAEPPAAPRDDQARDDQPRDERSRDQRPRDVQPDRARPRDDQPRDDQPRPVAARFAQPPRPAAPRAADPPMVRAAVLRARALAGAGRASSAGGDPFDRELADLLDQAAAPIEITVDAASRELAERLGGAAVERRAPGDPHDRGDRVSIDAAEPADAAQVDAALVDAAPVDAAAQVDAASVDAADPPTPPPSRAMSLDEALADDLPDAPMDRVPDKNASGADMAPMAMKAPPPGDGGPDPERRGLLHRLLRTRS